MPFICQQLLASFLSPVLIIDGRMVLHSFCNLSTMDQGSMGSRQRLSQVDIMMERHGRLGDLF